MKGLTVLAVAIFFAGCAVAQNITTKTLANGTVIEYIEYVEYTEYTYDDPTNLVGIFHLNRRPDRDDHHHNRRTEHLFGIANVHFRRIQHFHVVRIADHLNGIVRIRQGC
ncbi:hypothetical protein quinque_003733 [Culex quinquefasciatus]